LEKYIEICLVVWVYVGFLDFLRAKKKIHYEENDKKKELPGPED